MIFTFIVGLVIFLYPTVSNALNQINATHAVEAYNKVQDQFDTETYEKYLSDAKNYNEMLKESSTQFINGDPKGEQYKSILNVSQDGMIGYISIKKLSLILPIYHGTSDKTLATSIGHLEGSSFPIGGNGTHAVISGHRGLPYAKLFTDLDRLEKGDIFTITVLGQELTYMVDQIKTVKPNETDDLKIDINKDYVTLLTCTPYAVNTHRLLVRGVRSDPVDQTLSSDEGIDIFIWAVILIVILLSIIASMALFSKYKKAE